MKKIFLLLLLVATAVVAYSQPDSLSMLIQTIIHPPTTQAGSATEIFSAWTTWATAVVAFLTIYISKWLPFLGPVFSFMKPYWRYVIIGLAIVIAAIKLNLFTSGAAGWVMFISSLFYEILKYLGLGKDDKPTPSIPSNVN